MNNNNFRGYPMQSARLSAQCDCRTEGIDSFPAQWSYAMAYVPFQQGFEPYTSEKALMRGTLFPCLDKPFMMGCCK